MLFRSYQFHAHIYFLELKKKGGTTFSLTTEFSTFLPSDLHYYLSDALFIFWWQKSLVAPNMIILKNLLVFTLTISLIADFIFLGSKITVDGDCSHEIKRRLLLGRKFMTNLDSIFKSRDATLPTKVHLVKAMVFPVVILGRAQHNPCGFILDPKAVRGRRRRPGRAPLPGGARGKGE